MISRACVCLWRSGCARGRKTCMLVAGPPRDGIIRTSPGQECSKDKGALPGARRISVYAARFRSAAGRKTRVCFKPHRLILHLGEKRVSLCSAKRQSARSSMDRASDYGSEGWGFESLRARSGPPRCDPPAGVLHFRKHSCGSAFLCSFRDCDGPSKKVLRVQGLRCPWAVAGPGRASRRRAERSSRRGRLAGGPPPTGAQSSPAQQGARPKTSGTGRRHDPRLGRQGTQSCNPESIRNVGGTTRPGHSQGGPDKRNDVLGGPAQAS